MSERIASITLDESSILKRSREVEHEKSVAIADLLGDNVFDPVELECGPYEVYLRVEESRLVFDIHAPQAGAKAKVALSLQPLRSIVRDYFLVCESYYQALKVASPCSKIEAMDMGRRGLHNEGAETLQAMLTGKIAVDFATARRLFTLICVLHIK